MIQFCRDGTTPHFKGTMRDGKWNGEVTEFRPDGTTPLLTGTMRDGTWNGESHRVSS